VARAFRSALAPLAFRTLLLRDEVTFIESRLRRVEDDLHHMLSLVRRCMIRPGYDLRFASEYRTFNSMRPEIGSALTGAVRNIAELVARIRAYPVLGPAATEVHFVYMVSRVRNLTGGACNTFSRQLRTVLDASAPWTVTARDDRSAAPRVTRFFAQGEDKALEAVRPRTLFFDGSTRLLPLHPAFTRLALAGAVVCASALSILYRGARSSASCAGCGPSSRRWMCGARGMWSWSTWSTRVSRPRTSIRTSKTTGRNSNGCSACRSNAWRV
jgi:hypothetical protein